MIAIAETLVRVVAAIGITGHRWRSNLPPESLKHKSVLTDPAFVELRFESRDWCSLVQNSVRSNCGMVCET